VIDVATTQMKRNVYLRDPDVQLMLRVQGGDDAAFAELVSHYQDRLISIFSNMVSAQETAEDLAQEVFLRVYRFRDRYQPAAKFSTWLFRIANNMASNLRRSAARRHEVALSLRDSSASGVQPAGKVLADKSGLMPTRQADARETRDIVRAAMETLNDRQRMAVLLNKFEQMSYTDIGVAMNMSPSAVKSLLSRARENLRAQLEPYMN